MEILTALGVNWTIWLQFACFIIAYLAISQLIFKPYQAAFDERANRTVGNEEVAERILQETNELQSQYETRAREINNQFKTIYDKSRSEATREHDRIVQAARQQASELLEKNRTEIGNQVTQARKQLTQEAPAVGLAIASKLMGKDLRS